MVLPHSSVQHLMQSEVLLSGCRVLNEVCCKKGSNSLLCATNFSERCMHDQTSTGPVPLQQQVICVGNGMQAKKLECAQSECFMFGFAPCCAYI